MEGQGGNAAAIRAFRVLEVVAQRDGGCALSELAVALGLPKQTVHRLVVQLQRAGVVLREPRSRRVQLGSRVDRFSTNVLMNSSVARERHAILLSLVDDIGETCNVTTLCGAEVIYLDRVETSWPLRLILAPGSRVPLHATASGKMLLSLLPKAQRERLINQLPLRSFTETTIVDRRALARELVETRGRRVGINRAEHLRGMTGVAVPVMIDRQRACAAVALQAPSGRMTLEELLRYVPRLNEAAAAIGRTFSRPPATLSLG